MANQKISDIYASAPKTSLAGTEQVEINDGGTTKATLTSSIAALARNLTRTDHDISGGNQTYALTFTADSFYGVSWTGGDGTYTFSFTNTAGKFIDGIAATEYVGEGVGHLDLYCVDSSNMITINRGEIWDNDGGGHTFGTFNKKLDGTMQCRGQDTGTYSAANTTAVTYTFLAHADTSYIMNSWFDSSTDSSIWLRYLTSSKTTSGIQITFADDQRGSRSGTATFNFQTDGRWTTSYPRIT